MDSTADATGTAVERYERDRRHEVEPRAWLALEADRVFEELPGLGNEAPQFADGSTGFACRVRLSVLKRLRNELDEIIAELENDA